MGADYKAVAVIGIKIDTRTIPKIKESVKKPAFKHNYSEDDIFHPKTGKRLWTDEMMEVDRDVPKYTLQDRDSGQTGVYEHRFKSGELISVCLKQFPYNNLKINMGAEEDYIYYIGLVADNTYSNCGSKEDFKPIPDNIKTRTRDLLEPYGLWQEEDFGLYSILDCSC